MFLKDIAAASDIDVTTPSRWMRDEAFKVRYAQVLRDSHPILVEAAVTTLLQMTVKTGRVDTFDAAMDRLERHGRFGKDLAAMVNADTPGAGGPMVNIHVHQLPTRDSFESLPPPAARTLPAGATKAATAASAAPR